MSLSLYLWDPQEEEEVACINWLRNPFGLGTWAEKNTRLNAGLWKVCNQWSYAKSEQVNRPEFKRVVDLYQEAVNKLSAGYYYFDPKSFIYFINREIRNEIQIKLDGRRFNLQSRLGFNSNARWDELVNLGATGDSRICLENEGFIGIDMNLFFDPAFDLHPMIGLEAYKRWFSDLVEIAELLQDKRLEFGCSN